MLRTNRTVAIYWGPSSGFRSGYDTLIGQYFGDVAHASGSTANVYSVLSQYYDGTGSIIYSSSTGTAIYDTSAYPASGCNDTVSQTSICRSDCAVPGRGREVVQSPDPNTDVLRVHRQGRRQLLLELECAFTNYCAYHMHHR